jgi:P2 family phage contractile tail tube protein
MANTVYMMTAANLFCGDADPTNSKHLTLTELKLPLLQAIHVDHHPGGSKVAVEIEVGIQKFTPTFKLAGYDPDLLIQFGLSGKKKNIYTAYGVVEDLRTGLNIEAKAIFEAKLGKLDPGAFTRGNKLEHDYALNEVVHYEIWFDGKEKVFWDFFLNAWRVNGVDEQADANRILRIPAAAA